MKLFENLYIDYQR